MKCFECGLDKYHRMDCSSKILMMDYEAFVSKIEHLPEAVLMDLLTRCNVAMNRRKEYKENEIESLFDMYVHKASEETPEYCAANKDGECYHKGCPQTKNWQSSCPIPDLELE